MQSLRHSLISCDSLNVLCDSERQRALVDNEHCDTYRVATERIDAGDLEEFQNYDGEHTATDVATTDSARWNHYVKQGKTKSQVDTNSKKIAVMQNLFRQQSEKKNDGTPASKVLADETHSNTPNRSETGSPNVADIRANLPVLDESIDEHPRAQSIASDGHDPFYTEEQVRNANQIQNAARKFLAQNKRRQEVKSTVILRKQTQSSAGVCFKRFDITTQNMRTGQAKNTRLFMEKEAPGTARPAGAFGVIDGVKCVEVPTGAPVKKVGSALKRVLYSGVKKFVFCVDQPIAKAMEESQAVFARHPKIFHSKNKRLAYQLSLFATVLDDGTRMGYAPKIPGANLYEYDMFGWQHSGKSVSVLNKLMSKATLELEDELAAMNEDGVVYGDPKPHNIMYTLPLRPEVKRKDNGKEHCVIDSLAFDVEDPDGMHSLIAYLVDTGRPLASVFELDHMIAVLIDLDSVADKARGHVLASYCGTPLYQPYTSLRQQLSTDRADVDALLEIGKAKDQFGMMKLNLELCAENFTDWEKIWSCFDKRQVKTRKRQSVACMQTDKTAYSAMKPFLRRIVKDEYLKHSFLFLCDPNAFGEIWPGVTFTKMKKPTADPSSPF